MTEHREGCQCRPCRTDRGTATHQIETGIRRKMDVVQRLLDQQNVASLAYAIILLHDVEAELKEVGL